MPERVHKLQPDRTVYLRGFDSFAAAASIHSASPDGFTVSGTFRDPADFAVAVLYDADNFYEHPSIKYLPDFNLSGLTLNFSLRYSDSLQPIDSPKFNWIDWATLDCIRADGTTGQVRLWDNATLLDSSFPAASATCSVTSSSGSINAGDRLTLWSENLAFDYTASGQPTAEFKFFGQGPGTPHSITINNRTYPYSEPAPDGDSGAGVAGALIALITAASDADVTVSTGSASNAVLLTARSDRAGMNIPVSASDGNGPATLLLTSPANVAAALANAINAANWVTANSPYALLATANEAQITVTAARYGTVNVNGSSVAWASGSAFAGITAGSPILIGGASYTVASIQSPMELTLMSPASPTSNASYTAPRGGRDGNLIQIYSLASSPSTLNFDRPQIQLSGGRSDVTWNCTIDFTARGIDQLRQCWLTFAPSLTIGPYAALEWQAVFSNWQLTGLEATKTLNVAGAGSVRIEETDSACIYQGAWSVDSGFYSRCFANFTSDLSASVTITYTSQFTHDLYIGTSLYMDRAVAGVRLDGDTETSLDCRLTSTSPVITRRMLRSSVAPGRHVVTLRLHQAGFLYFDFLEAAVRNDFPDPLTPRADISPALDFDTDHTYKLPPARLMWIMDKLGYAGPMNEYLGVFWWNERTLSGGSVSSAQISFTGTFADGDLIALTLNGTAISKTVFPADTLATLAYHFAAYINGAFVGAWASAAGPVLTITSRSPAPAYGLIPSVTVTSATGQGAITQPPQMGVYGTWVINDAANPPINRAIRDWHADFYAQCASRNREVVTACSMELVNPPDGYVARFPDSARTAVSTATGFGTLVSNHCAAGSSKLLAYQKTVYRNIAQMQATAGLTPAVQYGEFLWWYFAFVQNVAVGYASYTSPISIGTASAHGLSTDARVVITGVNGNSAANGTWTVAVTDATHFTLNGSGGNGTYTSGGTINGGGMAFYDDETLAAAQSALGRPLFVFSQPNDDPSVNGGADTLFLRNRLRDHVAALATDIRAAFPSVKCEVLWPYDVNYPIPVPTGNPSIGGQLNRSANLPVEWQSKPASGLDRVKIEALAFGSSIRDLDLAKAAIGLFPAFGWPLDSLRYLVPVFGSATPWHRELALAKAAGILTNNLWAFDHICLFNLDVPERSLERRSVVKAG